MLSHPSPFFFWLRGLRTFRAFRAFHGLFLLLRFSPTGLDSVALAALPVLGGNLVIYINI